MSSPLISEFYDRHTEMINYLNNAGELSFVSSLNDTFRRSLLLAIASYFEHRITHMMLQVPVKLANGHPIIVALIERQVVSRKYHQFFDWEKANVNKFLSMFGDRFLKSTQKKIAEAEEIAKGAQSFLQLGDARNQLVHGNFASFTITLTPEDMMVKFGQAITFVTFLEVAVCGEVLDPGFGGAARTA